MALIDRILTPLRRIRQSRDYNDQGTWFAADYFRIRVEHVTKRFLHGKQLITALDDLSLEVLDGEFLAIVGVSGAGKTTLLNILAGWEQPSAGLVRVFGRDPSKLPGGRTDPCHMEAIGYVPQKRVWIDNLSVIDTLELSLLRTVDTRALRLDRAMDVLHLLRMSKLASFAPAELTVSEQVKVALARAMVAQPRLLLLDQLGGGSDSDTTAEILQVLRRLNQCRGTTIILTTCHGHLPKFASTIKMLVDGRLQPYHAGYSGSALVRR